MCDTRGLRSQRRQSVTELSGDLLTVPAVPACHYDTPVTLHCAFPAATRQRPSKESDELLL